MKQGYFFSIIAIIVAVASSFFISSIANERQENTKQQAVAGEANEVF